MTDAQWKAWTKQRRREERPYWIAVFLLLVGYAFLS